MKRAKIKYSGYKDIGILIAIVLMSFLVFISGMKVFEYSIKGYFSTGLVDVNITSYEVLNGKYIKATDKTILPGDSLSYIPEITNLGEKSYVRVKLEFVMNEVSSKPITTDNIIKLNNDWIQKGAYFYCTKILNRDEKTDIFQGITIPNTWTKDTAVGFDIKIISDVIQANNFTPNFDSSYPWGAVEIEEAKNHGQNEYREVKQIKGKNILSFDGGKGFESSTKNLFQNFNTYVTGNSFKDNLTIRNLSNKKIDVYFKTENKPSDLLRQMILTIRWGDKTLYTGNLASKKLNTWVKLATLPMGNEKKLNYVVRLPSKSKNYYSVLKDNVNWQFKCNEVNTAVVETGDNAKIIFWTILFILSISVIGKLVIKRNKFKERK